MDEQIALAMRSYLHRIARGATPADAEAYLRGNFGLTNVQVDNAILAAEQALEIGTNLQALVPGDFIGEALAGQAAPSFDVVLSVVVHATLSNGQERDFHILVDASWDETYEDVGEAVDAYLTAELAGTYDIEESEWEFEGPALWPLHNF